MQIEKPFSIFRNQPSYKFYNKSFEDDTDPLFLGLSEIDPQFLKEEEQLLRDKEVFRNNMKLDPRNGAQINEHCVDHTLLSIPKIFESPCRSMLTKKQHMVCLRVLQAIQERCETSKNDLCVFKVTEKKRQMEQMKFLKFISEWNGKYSERMYKPARPFLRLHREWFLYKAAQILKEEEIKNYNTYSGFPHVKTCTNKYEGVKIEGVETVERTGYVWVWEGGVDFQKLRLKLETFHQMYMETSNDYEHFMHVDTSQIFSDNIDGQDIKIICSLESLLFMFLAGDYPDVATEMFLSIEEIPSKGKLIRFHNPLPARNCGWHTNTTVVEQAFMAYQATNPKAKWLHLDQGDVNIVHNKEGEEIFASSDGGQLKYRLTPFDDFVQKFKRSDHFVRERMKFSRVLVRWSLFNTNTSQEIDISTCLPQGPTLDERGHMFVPLVSIKLQYKPQFGCEVLTKYELLKEWLNLKLLSNTSTSPVYILRIHLDVSTFETMHTEKVSLEEIEEELKSKYSVLISQRLNGLFDLLEFVQKISNGRYLLRFSGTNPDKLLLCFRAEQITRNTVNLHSLFRTEPNDMVFMLQNPLLRIMDNVCTKMHIYHKVLPCTFAPSLKEGLGKIFKEQYNDREEIICKKQKKDQVDEAKRKALKKKAKIHQKGRRKKRLQKEKLEVNKQQEIENEIDREIEIDKMFYGFSESAL